MRQTACHAVSFNRTDYMSYTYEYPRPALTVDGVIFGYDSNERDLRVLLILRSGEPYRNYWALPGGFVEMDEDLDTAALRELQEETGLHNIFLEQLYTFGAPNRDPRGRVVSVAYYALISLNDSQALQADSDAQDARWFSIDQLPPLAFDHTDILQMALLRLQGKIRYMPIGFELLPEKFPLSQLQHLYETILKGTFEKRNFRKKILSLNILTELDETQQGVPHRAARLYSFDPKKYEQLVKNSFDFKLDLERKRKPAQN